MNCNKKFLLMIIGVIVVAIFWIGWVSTNPADEKAMATFVSVEKLMKDNMSQRTKLGGLVKDGSIVVSKPVTWTVHSFLKKEILNWP